MRLAIKEREKKKIFFICAFVRQQIMFRFISMSLLNKILFVLREQFVIKLNIFEN